MIKLGVNIDHIATLRQARREAEPDPVAAAAICELAGADSITAHLREDRRHIQDRDMFLLRQTVKTKLNMEMAAEKEIIKIALKIRPDDVCLVPEKRAELTTEGGLDVVSQKNKLKEAVKRLHGAGIRVSLFIDPREEQVIASAFAGADCVELHTGKYALERAKPHGKPAAELKRLELASRTALENGLILNAGHGLDYRNVLPVANINGMNELNIGFSIIARAVIVGLDRAVREMKDLL
ncbi:MAG TPA: pyridoxine 5'-phosphate synthase [Elusimicrobia bacterium]|nr:MAG: pyridoxine 5'-phosphate synthase [Elusimicrobia bacterium RIFOXYA12_FULL_49_49]OGS09143.1 MAG: pyridoxine 5'-phosphate synthase [Elusimicrobia bacterium RIFOXYA1_FULL_47_7]OGS14765.1 MAG: pyridoxine 5'-phosphate synthase [Elusimicrobia bacterium RIFOXYA2_FULL_47_53]OGS25584.1 MAG: pyridoxine 5'-phosphate synthase [Elusimicrobia bacterium RIFOXYB12_FULL_50_12]OGS28951.1 MAG: pyridoxine 5'-phosphate synthase [Elusimicrobia bacterium RIFOXYB2_FULL_46_23]HBU69608.1 pyridoxine 5'-phosphate 